MDSKIIVGLDIGTTKIVCMVGRRTEFNKIEILGMGKSESIGVKRGVVANIDKTVESIIAAVQQAEDQSGVIIRDVNVGIAGQHIKSLRHRGQRILPNVDMEVSQQDIDMLIEDAYRCPTPSGDEIIDVLPQEFIIDGEQGIKNPIGHAGMKVEADFHIITGHVTAVKNIIKCVEKAGLNPVDIILEPIASSEAVLTNEEKEAGICLVDIGGGTTDVAIFQDGIIRHTAVIPFGGDIITEDIKEGCTIIKNQAELLKVKFGSALAIENQENEIVSIPGLRGREPKEISIKNLANIIQARVEEIIEQVYFEIKNSGYEKKLIGGIVITGGGSLLKHISQLIEFTTGKYVRIGYPNEHLAPSKANDITSPIFATSVGLIIVGLNEAEKSGGNKNTFEIKSPEQEPIISVKEEEIKVEVKPKVEKTEKEKRSGNLLDFFRKFFEDDTE